MKRTTVLLFTVVLAILSAIAMLMTAATMTAEPANNYATIDDTDRADSVTVRAFYHAINELLETGDASGLRAVVADGFVAYEFAGLRPTDLAGFVHRVLTVRSGCPECVVEPQAIVVESGAATVRVATKEPAVRSFLGLPLTGPPAVRTHYEELLIVDGKIADYWGADVSPVNPHPIATAMQMELPTGPSILQLLHLTVRPGAGVAGVNGPGPQILIVETGVLTIRPVAKSSVAGLKASLPPSGPGTDAREEATQSPRDRVPPDDAHRIVVGAPRLIEADTPINLSNQGAIAADVWVLAIYPFIERGKHLAILEPEDVWRNAAQGGVAGALVASDIIPWSQGGSATLDVGRVTLSAGAGIGVHVAETAELLIAETGSLTVETAAEVQTTRAPAFGSGVPTEPRGADPTGTEVTLVLGDSVTLRDGVVDSIRPTGNAHAGMTVAKVDDKTVKITMDSPLSLTLFLPKVANYNGGFIVCSKAVEALGLEGFKTQPVGTGPFMFSSYTPQTNVTLTANDQYFRGAPKLGGVEVRYMPDATSRELALQSGELDAASGLNEAQWVDRINAEGNLTADVFGPGEVAFVNLNIENEFLSKPQVRQAIAHAINREEHQALYGSPVSEIVYSVVPAALMPGGLTQEEATAAGVDYPYDVEKAKQLLAEAGYPDGFEMTLVTSEMPAYRANYEVLQSELAEIGIEIELQVIDHATMHSQIREDVNAIVIYVANRPNADVFLTQFFYSPSIVVTGASPVTNFSHYSAIDDLILQARAETDTAAQEELWRQANTQILKDVAAIPLQFQRQVYARTANVDYGHELVNVQALYPGIDETTTLTS